VRPPEENVVELMKKKHRRESEVLIYKPETHWIAFVRPFLIAMLFFALWRFFFITQLFNSKAGIVRYLKVILVFTTSYFVWQLPILQGLLGVQFDLRNPSVSAVYRRV
jgi:hypothetical protein